MFPLKPWHILLLSVSSTIVLCCCVEEDQPELFLPPRNFNPHPYQAGYEPGSRASGNNGPVLFPETPPESPSVDTNRYEADADVNPYVTVARKRKYKLAGRYQNRDKQLNSAVHKALSAHAAKVLRMSPSQPREPFVRPGYVPEEQNYAFSYKVLDHNSGDDYSHSQSQDSRATKGEYRVKLPDGRVQIVSYTADKNGYNAEVTYSGNENTDRYSKSKHDPPPSQNSLDYQQKYAYYFAPTITQAQPTPATLRQDLHSGSKYVADNKVDYITVNAKPYYNLPSRQLHQFQGPVERRINIYSPGNYVASTVAPNLDTYAHYVVTPKYEYVEPPQQYIYKK